MEDYQFSTSLFSESTWRFKGWPREVGSEQSGRMAYPSGLNLRVPQPFTIFVKGADFEFGPWS